MTGLLLLDKPEGITSFKAVATIKRLLGEKRVGHTGTLDPMATGVLPILIGRATTLSSYLLDANKKYVAKIRLGTQTDSGDITGNVINEGQVSVSNDDIARVLPDFIGKITQTPPMYSAIKKDGKRLYELARKGENIEVPERQIEIFSITQLSGLENNEFEIEVFASKGTYIRSLAVDIGRALGCYATLSSLRRTSTSGFDIKDCVSLEKLNEENIKEYILPCDLAVSSFREIAVTQKQALRFCNGGQLDIDRLKLLEYTDGEIFKVKYNDLFLGLGYINTDKNQLSIKCIVNYL